MEKTTQHQMKRTTSSRKTEQKLNIRNALPFHTPTYTDAQRTNTQTQDKINLATGNEHRR